jgi:hypothetical protein
MQMDLDPVCIEAANPWIAVRRAEEKGADTLYRLRATTK